MPAGLSAAVEAQRQREQPPSLAEMEAAYIAEILAATQGNKTECARILGISRKNLYEKIARYKVTCRMRCASGSSGSGKTRDARLRALIDDYAERLSHFVRCEVTELRELGRADKAGIDKETKRISDASPSRRSHGAFGSGGHGVDVPTVGRAGAELGRKRDQGSRVRHRRTERSGRRFQDPRRQALVAFAVDADARDGASAVI